MLAGVLLVALTFWVALRPSLLLAESLRLLMLALGCAAISLALGSNDQKRLKYSTFGIFALAFTAFEACPDSICTWVHYELALDMDLDEPFATPAYVTHRVVQAWFSLLASITAVYTLPNLSLRLLDEG